MWTVAAQLLADPAARERMGANARSFIAAHRGATDRLWAWLAPRIEQAPRRR
jgi:3-deoxy-D-manno-octulosonic-acid transferase